MPAFAALPLARLLRWPVPALLAWLLCWCLHQGLAGQAWPRELALGSATAAAALLGLLLHSASPWRRLIVAGGFPLSAWASGLASGLPAWAWLAPLLLLLGAYPLHAWSDAPLFPTPAQALHGLSQALDLPVGARVLDAGCGLGQGLAALHGQWPQARIDGVEWSAPLAWMAARRCRFARVARGDMWATSWQDYDLVYLFQRPESMDRAWAKASAEMRAGSWLASLEFAVPGLAPGAVLGDHADKPVWLYRVGGGSGSTPCGASR